MDTTKNKSVVFFSEIVHCDQKYYDLHHNDQEAFFKRTT